MDNNKFQSSFIPKASMPGTVRAKTEGSGFGKMAGVISVIALFGLGGLFAYKKIEQSKISSLEGQMAAAESTIDSSSIKQLSNFDKKLKAASQVVSQHQALSQYMSFLENSTLAGLTYSSFSYKTSGQDMSINAILTGSAPSYAAIAQEENILTSNPQVISATFDGFKLNKNGHVGFNLSLQLKGDLVKWSNLPQNQVDVRPATTTLPAPVATTTATTTTLGNIPAF